MTKIFYPTLDKFIYQLAEGLGDDPDKEGEANLSAFLELFPKAERTKIKKAIQDKKKSLQSGGLTQLLSQPNFLKLSTDQAEDATGKREGFYYPVISADTLGLLFNCSALPANEPQSIDCFSDLKKISPQAPKSLGITWMLSGYIKPENKALYLAQTIYNEFRENTESNVTENQLKWEWDQHLEGTFLRYPLYWIPAHVFSHSETSDRGLAILIYTSGTETIPNPDLEKVTAKLKRDWVNLFGFQNKILWAYDQAATLKEQLDREFIAIRSTFIEIQKILPRDPDRPPNVKIEEIQNILKQQTPTLSRYAIYLCYLEIQISTIETNLHNYELCLENLERQAQTYGETSLDCFRDFVDRVKNQYQKQVQKDYDSLKPGLTALENLINPIKSILDLEQGDRDRALQDSVQAIGVGIAAGAIVASSSSLWTIPMTSPLSQNHGKFPHPFAISILLSSLCAIGAWRFAKWRINQKRSKSQ